jgi:protein-disulfide isomerase
VTISRRVVLAAPLALAACAPKPPPTRSATGGPADAEILPTKAGDVPFDGRDPQDGPRTAPVVILTFADFQCPFCREAALTIADERKKNPGRTRLVFKHYPLAMHPRARGIAMVAQTVFFLKGPAAFWAIHDKLFGDPAATDDTIRGWATDLGATPDAMEAVADRAAERVGSGVALARLLGLKGAPGVFVNRELVDGAPPPDLLHDLVRG